MSKAILVMDMPDSCLDCRFCREMDEGIEACCEIMDEPDDSSLCRMIEDYCQCRPSWCPLRELPEKKRERYGLCRQNSSGSWDTYGEKVDSVAVGYNQCLDDICKLG